MDISVIIPCYNCEKTIRHALESVYSQSFPPKEIICVDDGSSDNTPLTLQEFARKPNNIPLRVIRIPNSGPSTARNIGVSFAMHPWIAFLDADDSWYSSKLEMQAKAHAAESSAALISVFANTLEEKTPKLKGITFSMLLRKNYFITSTVVVKKSVFEAMNGFPEHKSYSEDYYLWLHIVHQYHAIIIQKPLIQYYTGEGVHVGLSTKLWKMQINEIENYRVLQRKGMISLGTFIVLAVFSFLKFSRRLVNSLFR